MTTIYLTSTNHDKHNASKLLIKYNLVTHIICVESDSGIVGGQPYGLPEIKQGCINRTKQFKNNENFISIENGFVKDTDELWYDVAFIYLRINNNIYCEWTYKRYFPKELYNDTQKLIKYFEDRSLSRYKQLCNGILSLISKM